MKKIRTIVQIDEDLCNGCGQCILDCAEGAIRLVDGKAKVIADMYCDGLGACLSGCPTGALSLIQREADDYDEAAVEAHLAKQGRTLKHAHGHSAHGHGTSKGCPGSSPFSAPSAPAPSGGCGCSHSAPEALQPKTASPFEGGAPAPSGCGCSGKVPAFFANTHWPLKLGLMNPEAPFLQGADLLLAADCAAFAAASFHQKLRAGKVLLIACPKFEGMDAITDRLTELFRHAKPKSCVVARMEVPCCRPLLLAAQEAARRTGVDVKVEEVVVARDGSMG